MYQSCLNHPYKLKNITTQDQFSKFHKSDTFHLKYKIIKLELKTPKFLFKIIPKIICKLSKQLELDCNIKFEESNSSFLPFASIFEFLVKGHFKWNQAVQQFPEDLRKLSGTSHHSKHCRIEVSYSHFFSLFSNFEQHDLSIFCEFSFCKTVQNDLRIINPMLIGIYRAK